MSAAESEVVQADDGADQTARFRKAMLLLAKSQQMIIEATEMLESMRDKTKRVKELDANGEPTWTYMLKQPIPKDFRLTKKFIADAAEHGFGEESAKILMHGKDAYEGFIKYYTRVSGERNGKWTHWSLVWQKWLRTERDRKDKAKNGQQPAATRFDRQRTRV